MDEATFWRLIDETRAAGGDEQQAAALEARLRAGGLDDVVGFGRMMDRCLDALYTWDLWAVAYLVQGGCSDDGFEYFRCWVIASGRDAFTLASTDPVAFGSGIDPDGDEEDREREALLYVAGRVHEELTGEYGPPRETPPPAEPAGEPWDEDDLDERYPDLARRWS